MWNNATAFWTGVREGCRCEMSVRSAAQRGLVQPEQDTSRMNHIKGGVKGSELLWLWSQPGDLRHVLLALRAKDVMSEPPSLVLQPGLVAVPSHTLSPGGKGWSCNEGTGLQLRFGCDFCLCCWVLSRLLDLRAGVQIKPVVRACLCLCWGPAPVFSPCGSQGVLGLDLALI